MKELTKRWHEAARQLDDDIYLLSQEQNGKWKEELLITGGKGKRFEALRYFDSSIGWSRDGNRLAFIAKSGKVMVFSAFQKTNWQLYRTDVTKAPVASPQLASTNTTVALAENNGATATATAKAWLPDIPDPNTLYANYQLAPADSIESRQYSSKFKLDAISVGGGYDTYFINISGFSRASTNCTSQSSM